MDPAALIKFYGPAPEASRSYSPPVCVCAWWENFIGHPDPDHVSASYVERSNLSMWMGIPWFTRLSNAFSMKAKNH